VVLKVHRLSEKEKLHESSLSLLQKKGPMLLDPSQQQHARFCDQVNLVITTLQLATKHHVRDSDDCHQAQKSEFKKEVAKCERSWLDYKHAVQDFVLAPPVSERAEGAVVDTCAQSPPQSTTVEQEGILLTTEVDKKRSHAGDGTEEPDTVDAKRARSEPPEMEDSISLDGEFVEVAQGQ